MPAIVGVPRFLVKAAPQAAAAGLALAGDGLEFDAAPLFTSIGMATALGAAPLSTWHVLTPRQPLGGRNPWDVCHALLAGAAGLTAAPAVQFAEPDFQQAWLTGQPAATAIALAGVCGDPAPEDNSFPTDPDVLWFHDQAHAQFAGALAALGDIRDGDRVRVAHLDTGYDPAHEVLPARLETVLRCNFVDSDRPDDASDDTGGPLNNLGHGTGTIGILAGAALPGQTAIGCAPFASVVPLRVADRVVLFSNSSIAQALDRVHELCSNPATRVHVVTMSMGGIASQAWAEAVNALYEAGVFIVTAAGNNFDNLPTRNIVFPARFNRVVAACGVMADHAPYADLGFGKMAGNYGPPSKMRTAVAAFTPNVPWAKLGCESLINWNGAGTSAATPQIAAAAAIWIQQNRPALDAYPQAWMRVEAVRMALFGSANDTQRDHLGRGQIRVRAALDAAPVAASALQAEQADSASFSLLRTLIGIGVAPMPDHQLRMLELEALQLSQSAAIEALLPDPNDPKSLKNGDLNRLREALIERPGASQALRAALGSSAPRGTGIVVPELKTPDAVQQMREMHLEHAANPPVRQPVRRHLRVYAYDPSLGTSLETLGINEAIVDVPWEKDLQPGPVGEYLEVIDIDPASDACYAPVDLNDPALLAQSGLRPSEATPRFHQQMVYAVAMTTIEHFERALGRLALWSPREGSNDFVRRLRIYPHAIRAANAFYSPERKALLLGYFSASQTDPGDQLPGGLIFSALSHDIVAHETTHALLDGLHRRFREPTNADVLAFHEAFADVVALFQHFTLPAALTEQIARTRGDLLQESLLGELAVQFGQATGRYGALRDAIGEVQLVNGERRWVPRRPKRTDYQDATEPHARGSVLVAAIFDAFQRIYRTRTLDLERLATGGTGVLPPGAISVDLTNRLAHEASKVAAQVLGICIRALDYCPPVDITFGEYLRALITADRDLVPEDTRTYRVAFVEGFRARGIYPQDVRSLSVDTLSWEPPATQLANVGAILDEMSLDWDLRTDRPLAYSHSLDNARKVHAWLMKQSAVSDKEIAMLGLSRTPGSRSIGATPGKLGPIEIHSVRPARRVGPDGQLQSDLVVEITQTFRPDDAEGLFRGGCTLLIDLLRKEVRYLIRKRIDSASRLGQQQQFQMDSGDWLRATYLQDAHAGVEPFAVLHRPW